MEQWCIICNPVAGKGKGIAAKTALEATLSKRNIPFVTYISAAFQHTITLAANAYREGYRQFIAIGGDGTLHEAINGIAAVNGPDWSACTFALLPVGKGNDWRRSVAIPERPTGLAQQLSQPVTINIDAGKVTYQGEDGATTRYFINMAGAGFDGAVVQSVSRLFRQGKRLSTYAYLWQLVLTLFRYRASRVSYLYHDKPLPSRVLTAAIALGRYNGGGMCQAPHAMPDDGRLAITVIENMAKIRVVANLHRLYNGTIGQHPKVKTWHTRQWRIDGAPIPLEADGEWLGTTPATFCVIPGALRIIVAPQ